MAQHPDEIGRGSCKTIVTCGLVASASTSCRSRRWPEITRWARLFSVASFGFQYDTAPRRAKTCAKLTVIAFSQAVCVTCLSLFLAMGQVVQYPHNAISCERCHSVPTKFGSNPMTVVRMGSLPGGKFIPTSEGGIHHRTGESGQSSTPAKQITGERVSLSLLGDGYIEAIDSRDIEQRVLQQREADLGIAGIAVSAPVLEASGSATKMQLGRFGWKSQHSSLMSSCADSLRNELGIRNRLKPGRSTRRFATATIANRAGASERWNP